MTRVRWGDLGMGVPKNLATRPEPPLLTFRFHFHFGWTGWGG